MEESYWKCSVNAGCMVVESLDVSSEEVTHLKVYDHWDPHADPQSTGDDEVQGSPENDHQDQPAEDNLPENSTVLITGTKSVKSIKTEGSKTPRKSSGRIAKSHTCSLCLKSFPYLSKLQTHMAIHKGDKPFRCDVCEESFLYKQTLVNHMVTHTGKMPFSCDECGKKFSWDSTLRRHISSQHSTKSYSCHICQREFKHISTLRSHVKRHSETPTFSCGICSKVFISKGNLRRHEQSHFGEEKRFECDQCEKKYFTKFSLTRHKQFSHYTPA